MLIRPARVEDAGALARVHVDSWHVAYRGLVPDAVLQRMTYEWSEERLRGSLASGSEETYLAFDGQTIVGLLTLGACRDADLAETSSGEIWGIYIAPDHWRQGIGRRFVHFAERLLAARGCEQATLWVLAGNAEARRFYEEMGFRADGGTKTVVLGEPLEAVRYRKPLAHARELPWAADLAIGPWVDPFPALLSSGDRALEYFVRRDLLAESVEPVETLWVLPPAQKLVEKQQQNGSWRYPGKNRDQFPETNYDLLETFRSLRVLVEQHGFHRGHPAIARAASYVFGCQAEEGDIRGILGTQYMPYYHAVITELLIKAGYANDSRIDKGMVWLLSMRQDDGGWIVPAQAVPAKEKTRELWNAPAVLPPRSLPFSHMATGMVLRAFGVHPRYRDLPEARAAAEGLKARFFRPDKYNDRKAPLYWTKFQFPFWWPNLLTALDTLSLMGFSPSDPQIRKGIEWFATHQQEDGLWLTSYEQAKRPVITPKERSAQLWVALAICRVLGRFCREARTGLIQEVAGHDGNEK